MFQIPEFPLDPNVFGGGLTVGSLPWAVAIIISILIGPLVLMLAVRILGSSSEYGQCFFTWLFAIVILTIMGIVLAVSVALGPLIALIALVILVFVLCCYIPKFVADRHNLSGWCMGLIAIILAAIFNAILNWIVRVFFVFIPNIQLFSL